MKSTSAETTTQRTQVEKKTSDECSDDPNEPSKSPIVKVSFTLPKTFTFSCRTVLMHARGKIQLHQLEPTNEWVFVRPTCLKPPEFTYTVEGDGKTMTIEDNHTIKDMEYHYGIVVKDKDGHEHNSDDREPITNPPMIRNL